MPSVILTSQIFENLCHKEANNSPSLSIACQSPWTWCASILGNHKIYNFVLLYSQNIFQIFLTILDRFFICDFNSHFAANITKAVRPVVERTRHVTHRHTGKLFICTGITIRVGGVIRLRFEKQFIRDTWSHRQIIDVFFAATIYHIDILTECPIRI